MRSRNVASPGSDTVHHVLGGPVRVSFGKNKNKKNLRGILTATTTHDGRIHRLRSVHGDVSDISPSLFAHFARAHIMNSKRNSSSTATDKSNTSHRNPDERRPSLSTHAPCGVNVYDDDRADFHGNNDCGRQVPYNGREVVVRFT